MQSEQLTQLVVEALESVKAVDVRVMDVRGMTDITDFMVVASGRSNRQVRALAEKVVEAAKLAGVTPLGTEGEAQAEWVLVDLGDVVVHAMQPETREFYALEKLWSNIQSTRRTPSTAEERPEA